MKLIFSDFRNILPWEEVAGKLKELIENDEILIAHFREIRIALPSSLEKSLRPLIGQKISILRTDIPDQPYLFLVLDQETTIQEKATILEG